MKTDWQKMATTAIKVELTKADISYEELIQHLAAEDRNKVITEANKPQFKDLNTMFFPYSAVDELYALCQRRKLSNKAVNEEFLDCYMEPCLQSLTHH